MSQQWTNTDSYDERNKSRGWNDSLNKDKEEMAHKESYTTATRQGKIKRPQSYWWADTALRTYCGALCLALMCADSVAGIASK